MQSRVVLILATIALIASGCEIFSTETHLSGKLYLSYVDVDDQTGIYYRQSKFLDTPVVLPTVFAVGIDSNFIIAKQHPFAFPNVIDRSVTNFYIVPIDSLDSLRPEKCVIGPLTEEQFLQKRGELSVPNELSFTITNEDLE